MGLYVFYMSWFMRIGKRIQKKLNELGPVYSGLFFHINAKSLLTLIYYNRHALGVVPKEDFVTYEEIYFKDF